MAGVSPCSRIWGARRALCSTGVSSLQTRPASLACVTLSPVGGAPLELSPLMASSLRCDLSGTSPFATCHFLVGAVSTTGDFSTFVQFPSFCCVVFHNVVFCHARDGAAIPRPPTMPCRHGHLASGGEDGPQALRASWFTALRRSASSSSRQTPPLEGTVKGPTEPSPGPGPGQWPSLRGSSGCPKVEADAAGPTEEESQARRGAILPLAQLG